MLGKRSLAIADASGAAPAEKKHKVAASALAETPVYMLCRTCEDNADALEPCDKLAQACPLAASRKIFRHEIRAIAAAGENHSLASLENQAFAGLATLEKVNVFVKAGDLAFDICLKLNGEALVFPQGFAEVPSNPASALCPAEFGQINLNGHSLEFGLSEAQQESLETHVRKEFQQATAKANAKPLAQPLLIATAFKASTGEEQTVKVTGVAIKKDEYIRIHAMLPNDHKLVFQAPYCSAKDLDEAGEAFAEDAKDDHEQWLMNHGTEDCLRTFIKARLFCSH